MVKVKRQIYLDHAATTPTDPKVVKAMLPYFSDEFGNPSALYDLGRKNLAAITEARKKVAKILDCSTFAEIIFTGGGTESDNLAIFGAMRASGAKQKHIITTKIEHHAVLHTCQELEKEGTAITYLDVDKNGMITPEAVIKAIRKETVLVTIMMANNEVGTILPIAEIGKALEKLNVARVKEGLPTVLFHSDACQAAGVLDLNVNRLHTDLLTLNGSKIYGPKGVGVLFKKKNVRIKPMIFGGGQEFGLRSGTENVPAIIGLAEALELVQKNREKENARLTELREYLWRGLTKKIIKIKLNGHPVNRLPNNLNVSILDIEGEAMLLYLNEMGIQASTGSACTSQSLEPSHVLIAMGMPYEFAHGSLRFTLGHSTIKKDLDYVLEVLPGIVKKLREFSPVCLTMKEKENIHPQYKK